MLCIVFFYFVVYLPPNVSGALQWTDLCGNGFIKSLMDVEKTKKCGEIWTQGKDTNNLVHSKGGNLKAFDQSYQALFLQNALKKIQSGAVTFDPLPSLRKSGYLIDFEEKEWDENYLSHLNVRRNGDASLRNLDWMPGNPFEETCEEVLNRPSKRGPKPTNLGTSSTRYKRSQMNWIAQYFHDRNEQSNAWLLSKQNIQFHFSNIRHVANFAAETIEKEIENELLDWPENIEDRQQGRYYEIIYNKINKFDYLDAYLTIFNARRKANENSNNNNRNSASVDIDSDDDDDYDLNEYDMDYNNENNENNNNNNNNNSSNNSINIQSPFSLTSHQNTEMRRVILNGMDSAQALREA